MGSALNYSHVDVSYTSYVASLDAKSDRIEGNTFTKKNEQLGVLSLPAMMVSIILLERQK